MGIASVAILPTPKLIKRFRPRYESRLVFCVWQICRRHVCRGLMSLGTVVNGGRTAAGRTADPTCDTPGDYWELERGCHADICVFVLRPRKPIDRPGKATLPDSDGGFVNLAVGGSNTKRPFDANRLHRICIPYGCRWPFHRWEICRNEWHRRYLNLWYMKFGATYANAPKIAADLPLAT